MTTATTYSTEQQNPEQQSLPDVPSKGNRREGSNTSPKGKDSAGLQYLEDPKAIKKSIPPQLKEDIDFLVDFGMPDSDKLLLPDSEILSSIFKALENGNKAPRYWFNTVVKTADPKGNGYDKALWFILNLKATLLSPANANLLKEWRLSDKVIQQDIQEVAPIASLYDKKDPTPQSTEKIIEANTKKIKQTIFKESEEAQLEKRKEIILNIAGGSLGGLYKPLAKWGNGANETGGSKMSEQAQQAQQAQQADSNIRITVPLEVINKMLYSEITETDAIYNNEVRGKAIIAGKNITLFRFKPKLKLKKEIKLEANNARPKLHANAWFHFSPIEDENHEDNDYKVYNDPIAEPKETSIEADLDIYIDQAKGKIQIIPKYAILEAKIRSGEGEKDGKNEQNSGAPFCQLTIPLQLEKLKVEFPLGASKVNVSFPAPISKTFVSSGTEFPIPGIVEDNDIVFTYPIELKEQET